MLYRKNVTGKESIIRLIAGALMIACGLIGLQASMVGVAIAGMGIISIMTGVFGYCPACAMAGRQLDQTGK